MSPQLAWIVSILRCKLRTSVVRAFAGMLVSLNGLLLESEVAVIAFRATKTIDFFY